MTSVPTPAREPWLPDLCRLPRLAVMLGMSELVIVLLALAPGGGVQWDLERFVTASAFAQWLALTAAEPHTKRSMVTLSGTRP